LTGAAPWFEELPDRLDRELSDLHEVGATWQLNDAARAKGVLRLDSLMWPLDGGLVELAVVFPDLYPYFRPEVRAPRLQLPRHQAPGGGYLCLVNRDSRHWSVADTLAAYLTERLPLVMKAATTLDPEEAGALEEHQGEPFSDYLVYSALWMVVVDGAWTLPQEVRHGDLLLGVDPTLATTAPIIRGAVLQVLDPDGRVICEADTAFGNLFTGRLSARWVRVGSVPFHLEPGIVVNELRSRQQDVAFGPPQPFGHQHIALLALLFDEEIGYRKHAESWLFALQRAP
jgi:Prokaryotic E2 family B